MIRAIVTDIEGTTSSISFVKEVLFPYAAEHLPAFLHGHWDDAPVREQIAALRQESGEPAADPDSANRILQQWIREDRKATSLKALQGMLWDSGYRNGDYRAHMYPDAVTTLRAWHQQGIPLYVYSSGSIAAQKLFFGFSEAGDLTPLFSGYFDTTTGPKRAADSYRAIVSNIGLPASEVLFLSDIVEELDAAREAGLHTLLLDRDGRAPATDHECVTGFDQIDLTAL